MADHADLVAEAARLQGLPAADLAVAGGILRCTECGTEQPLGDVADHLSNGWPECRGQTMTWVTAKMLAAERREVPAGYHLEAVPETSIGSGGTWQIDSTRRCRYAAPRSCGKPSVASLLRGTKKPVWYGYCPDHMYGRFIQDGQVMCWILKADGDG